MNCSLSEETGAHEFREVPMPERGIGEVRKRGLLVLFYF